MSNRRIERPNSQFVSHAWVIVGSSRAIEIETEIETETGIGTGIGTGRNGPVGTVESLHPLRPLRPLVFCPWILRSALLAILAMGLQHLPWKKKRALGLQEMMVWLRLVDAILEPVCQRIERTVVVGTVCTLTFAKSYCTGYILDVVFGVVLVDVAGWHKQRC